MKFASIALIAAMVSSSEAVKLNQVEAPTSAPMDDQMLQEEQRYGGINMNGPQMRNSHSWNFLRGKVEKSSWNDYVNWRAKYFPYAPSKA